MIIVAGVLRFVNLDYKVLHHDEGVNHFFLQNLIRQGSYKYDPTNYHGPTLYFLSQPLAKWADKRGLMRPAVLRVVTASFGLGVIALCYGMRRRLGEEAALVAAALLAVSPGMVFISRYYIHEMILVCATLALLVCIFAFWDDPVGEGASNQGWLVVLGALAAMAAVLAAAFVSKKLVVLVWVSLAFLAVMLWLYDGVRAFTVVGAGLAAGMMFATKETAFITIGVFMIAATMAWCAEWFWRLWFPPPQPKGKKRQDAAPAGPVREAGLALAERGGQLRLGVLAMAFLAIFVVVNVTYYSSFFSNPKGVTDSFEAFKVWKKTGERDHVHPFYRYFEWLGKEEGFVLVIGLGGAFYLLTRSRPRAPIMVGLWAIGLVSAYSLIGYKTPWLLPNFILPLTLTTGWTLMKMPRKIGLPLLACGLALECYQCYQLNVIHYDDDRYVYVYGHTTRHLHDLIKSIEEVAAERQGKETKLYVASPDFWPIPFYLRDYKAVGYFSSLGDSIDQDMVIVNHAQVGEFEYKYLNRYRRRQGPVYLRPGVDLYLFEKLPLPPGVTPVQPSPAQPTMVQPYTPPPPVNSSNSTANVTTVPSPIYSVNASTPSP